MIIGVSGKIASGKDLVGKIIQFLTSDDIDMVNFLKEEPYNALHNWSGNFNNLGEWKIKKFADKLKDIVCILIGCTREQLEDKEFKEKELGEEWWKYQVWKGGTFTQDFKESYLPFLTTEIHVILENWENYELVKLTPRLLLQLIGTECGRNIIHPNIWVNSLMNEYKEKITTESFYDIKANNYTGITNKSKNNFPNWIITDLRFPNELKAIKDKKGITIRVTRDLPCTVCKLTKQEKRGSICNDITCPNQFEHKSETALDHITNWDYIINNDSTIEDLIEKVKEILIKEQIIK